jgi:hypothetical protein
MSQTDSPPDAAKTNATDRMLASLKRGTDITPDRLAGLASAPGTVQREVAVEQGDAPAPKKRTPAKPAKTQPASVSRNLDFDVSTGKGIKHLTIRVPKEMAADLSLLAMRNKLAENGEPTTINDLGIKALRGMLEAA